MTNSPDADDRPVLLEARDIVVHYGRIKALAIIFHQQADPMLFQGQLQPDLPGLGMALHIG